MTSRRALTTSEQLKILALIWDKGANYDGWVFLPWIPGGAKDKAERRQNWNEGPAFKWPEERDRIHDWMEAHRKDDLYFTPNVFLGETRVAQLTGEERVLFADLDEVDPREDIDPHLKPTIAWETSPGRFQAAWLLDSFADGACEAGGLNHRLTAFLGADPSGWDTTQLLRVPGRRNFKFNYKDDDGSSPPGQLLWVTDKRYSPDDLDSRLPKVETYGIGDPIEDGEIDRIDRHAVWGRVNLKVSHTVREYMSMKSRQIDPEQHDRSEIMWQIERDLADAGCTVAEIVALVRPSPWNKHAGRNNEMAQLKTEAQKAVAIARADAEEDTLGDPDSTRPAIDAVPTLMSLGLDRVPRPRWLIPRIWTEGSCGFLAGAPKSYKSYIGLDMAISVATGMPFLNDPQFGYESRPRKVIYVQEEDSLPLVLLRAEQIVEGKLSDAHWHGQIRLPEGEPGSDAAGLPALIWEPSTGVLSSLVMLVRQGFLSSDAGWHAWLLEMIQHHNADLAVIDTLSTTLGGVDNNKAEEMNARVFKPLKFIAETTGCAIAIVNHNKKNSDASRAGQNMLGSVAGHAWVESALYFHSKEKQKGASHTEVKVERESKLSEDLRFRVRVPTMWQGTGSDEGDAGRQVWEPQVLMDWGDSEEVREEEIVDTKAVAREEDRLEQFIVFFREHLGDGQYHTTDRVFRTCLDYRWAKTDSGAAKGSVASFLQRAVKKGRLDGSKDEGWCFVR